MKAFEEIRKEYELIPNKFKFNLSNIFDKLDNDGIEIKSPI